MSLESKAKTIVFLSNECFYKNANFEQLWVPLVDAQKEIEKHKESNEILFVANNYQADKIKGLEGKIEAANKKVLQFCNECQWGPKNLNNCDEDADECKVYALKVILFPRKENQGVE